MTIEQSPKSRINITLIAPQLPPGSGGMERQAYLQALALAKKTNLTVCSISSDANIFGDAQLKFIRLRPYKGALSREINAFRLFMAFVLKGLFLKQTIVYCHQLNLLTFMILVICRPFKTKIFVKVANSGDKFDLKIMLARYSFIRPFKSILESQNINFLCLSPSNKDDFEALGMRHVNIIPFRNGINLPPKINTEIKGNIIQYVGRLEPIKEVEYVLRLKKFLPDVDARIIGDGTLFKTLAAKARHVPGVIMPGEVSTEHVQWHDVEWAILPSGAEGMSNAILEALANGRGIICRPIASNRFLTELTDKIIWIEDTPQKVASQIMKKSGTEASISGAFSQFSVEHVVDDLLRIIRST